MIICGLNGLQLKLAMNLGPRSQKWFCANKHLTFLISRHYFKQDKFTQQKKRLFKCPLKIYILIMIVLYRWANDE